MSHTLRNFIVLIFAAAFALTATGAAAEAQVSFTSFTAPLTTTFPNPCAGEDVAVTGMFHVLLQSVTTPGGTRHVVTMSNFSNVAGVGSVSGDRYHAPSTGHAVFNGEIDTVNVTAATHSFRLLGQGPDNNVSLHGVLHITWNRNGELAIQFERVSVECR